MVTMQVFCDETLCSPVSFRGVAKSLGAFEASETSQPMPKRQILHDFNLRNVSKTSNPTSLE
jgi:hypothetical protein